MTMIVCLTSGCPTPGDQAPVTFLSPVLLGCVLDPHQLRSKNLNVIPECYTEPFSLAPLSERWTSGALCMAVSRTLSFVTLATSTTVNNQNLLLRYILPCYVVSVGDSAPLTLTIKQILYTASARTCQCISITSTSNHEGKTVLAVT